MNLLNEKVVTLQLLRQVVKASWQSLKEETLWCSLHHILTTEKPALQKWSKVVHNELVCVQTYLDNDHKLDPCFLPFW